MKIAKKHKKEKKFSNKNKIVIKNKNNKQLMKMKNKTYYKVYR